MDVQIFASRCGRLMGVFLMRQLCMIDISVI